MIKQLKPWVQTNCPNAYQAFARSVYQMKTPMGQRLPASPENEAEAIESSLSWFSFYREDMQMAFILTFFESHSLAIYPGIQNNKWFGFIYDLKRRKMLKQTPGFLERELALREAIEKGFIILNVQLNTQQ